MSSAIRLLSTSQSEKIDFPWGQLTWFANRALGNSEELTLGRCILKPGQANPRHYHPNCSEILTVLHGRIRHTLSDASETEMQEGDTVSVPPNRWHRATNIGDTEAVLLIAFSSADRETIGE